MKIKKSGLVLSTLLLANMAYADEAKLGSNTDGAATKAETTDGALEEGQKEKSGSVFKISGSYTPWFVNWEQKSTANTRFGAEAIEVDYAIKGAIAHTGKLSIEVMGFDFDFEVIELPKEKEGIEKSMSYLSSGINYVLPFAETKLGYRYTQASFSGALQGFDDEGNLSTGTFETDALTHNISAITKWGLGIGYRSFSYDLPQDIYLVSSSAPNTPIIKGFTNIKYDSDFIEFIFEENALFKQDVFKFNLGVTARFGFGKMNVGGEFVDAIRESQGEDVVGDADATVMELDIYGYMPVFKTKSLNADFVFGYRTETMKAEFPGGEEYSLVTDFETNFSGPYATINFIW